MYEWDDGKIEKGIYDLVEALNEDYGVKTIKSCKGHARRKAPYIIIEIPVNNVQYLRAAIREYDYRKGKETIKISGLEILIGEGKEEAVITFKATGIKKRSKKLRRQRSEFKETVLKVITAYVNEERRRRKYSRAVNKIL